MPHEYHQQTHFRKDPMEDLKNRCSATTRSSKRCRRPAVEDGCCQQHVRTSGTHNEGQRKRFLVELAKFGSVRLACNVAGVSRSSVYTWRYEDKDFAFAWDMAEEAATDVLEEEARSRAIEGQSDTMLMFLLKSLRPERFCDRERHRRLEPGLAKAPIPPESNINLYLDSLSTEELKAVKEASENPKLEPLKKILNTVLEDRATEQARREREAGRLRAACGRTDRPGRG